MRLGPAAAGEQAGLAGVQPKRLRLGDVQRVEASDGMLNHELLVPA